jgi:hypothetical protein
MSMGGSRAARLAAGSGSATANESTESRAMRKKARKVVERIVVVDTGESCWSAGFKHPWTLSFYTKTRGSERSVDATNSSKTRMYAYYWRALRIAVSVMYVGYLIRIHED